MQELGANPPIESRALGEDLDIRADPLAQIRHLVDEGHLGRKEAVGRVLDQLGGLERGEQDRVWSG